jgi:hypothetical protein
MRQWITTLGRLLGVVALSFTMWSSAATASTSVATRLAPGTIGAGRFVKAFALDGGAFRVLPAPASLGTRVVPRAILIEAWATSQVQEYSVKGIAFGLVTVATRFKGVRVVHSQPAWVGLVQYNYEQIQCPAFNGPFKTAPPSSGWAAVVLGSGNDPPDVVYIADHLRCGAIFHASLVNASETISLAWRDDNGGALVHVPACATVSTVSSGSSRSGPPDLAIWATRLDDPTAPGCVPAHPQEVTGSVADVVADPSTTHDPTGPVRMVNPGAK